MVQFVSAVPANHEVGSFWESDNFCHSYCNGSEPSFGSHFNLKSFPISSDPSMKHLVPEGLTKKEKERKKRSYNSMQEKGSCFDNMT